MPRLFGTDGVRGVANRDLTPDLVLALGRAGGRTLLPSGGEIVVGRDTRLSGPLLEGALVAGLASAGADVLTAGTVPSPAVAFLTLDRRAGAGAVISASHNPVPDNGIKFFTDQGLKLSVAQEEAIEEAMAEPDDVPLPTGTEVGSITSLEDASERYLEHLAGTVSTSLRGMKVVLDCAFGAAFEAAPAAFRAAGAEVVVLHAEPDGERINVDSGSTAPQKAGSAVVAEGADLGFAFDGDADRVLALDEEGRLVDGDQIIGLLALDLAERGELGAGQVVATVMSNLGFIRAMEANAIDVLTAPVGDKNVVEAMNASGAVLGGEQSGHIVFGRHATTGDGILTALQIAQVVARSGKPLSGTARFFEPFPQVLLNVEVAARGRLDSAESLWREINSVEATLGEDGRVLVRESGTEPLVRVMVEAADAEVARRTAEDLAEKVRSSLG
jgi:phosphoglucosamine mutase